MSTGFEAITLLKAAPEPDQIADRLEGGPWAGLELCLAPGENESYETGTRIAFRTRPLTDAVKLYVDWLRSHHAAQGRARA